MIIYLDTETTGLRPGNICQLSYIIQDKGNVRAKNFFFTVGYVEPAALMVHGFSVEKLKVLSSGKKFSDHLEEIELDFNSADVVIAHNTAFDFMFLRTEFERCGSIFAPNGEFCSMKKATPVCKIPRANGVGYKYPKLSELTCHLGVSDREILICAKQLFGSECGYHDARFDTCALFLAVNYGANKCEEFEVLKKFM